MVFVDLERGRVGSEGYQAVKSAVCEGFGSRAGINCLSLFPSQTPHWIPDILSTIPSCKDYLPQHGY